MRGQLAVIIICATAFGCRGEEIQVEAPVREQYRPSWSAVLAANVPAIAACLEGRESPSLVAYVESLPSGATGVSTIDAYGSIEHCAFGDGKVLHREPTQLSTADLVGSAVFSLGPQQPIVPVGVLVEEVFDEDQVIGWMYWLSAPEEEGAASPRPTAEPALQGGAP